MSGFVEDKIVHLLKLKEYFLFLVSLTSIVPKTAFSTFPTLLFLCVWHEKLDKPDVFETEVVIFVLSYSFRGYKIGSFLSSTVNLKDAEIYESKFPTETAFLLSETVETLKSFPNFFTIG